MSVKEKSKTKKIVVIGGGTGTFTVLSGLRKFRKKNNLELSAVVSMADDGGSTGILRDELGVLPPGDIRQCLVALSTKDILMRDLMNYRFDNGALRGHNFGNLLLSALEKVTGGFDTAVEKVSDILRCEGKIIPVTLSKVTLVAKFQNGSEVRGQKNIHISDMSGLYAMSLYPKAKVNPKAVEAIMEADLIVIGPGDLYSSIVPNFIMPKMSQAILKTDAKKVYICNLMTKAGHTDGLSVEDFAMRIENYLDTELDAVIYNNKKPQKKLIEKYKREGEELVDFSGVADDRKNSRKFIGGDLLNRNIQPRKKGDFLSRNLIRHSPELLAKLILGALN